MLIGTSYPSTHCWNGIGFTAATASSSINASFHSMKHEWDFRAILTEIAKHGAASFLSVLKRMGKQSFGYLSFPFEGYTLAMDFPATPLNLRLLDRLDRIMLEHRGRIYLAKDARAAPTTVASGYPELDNFRLVRRRYGLEGRCKSHLSRRLEL